MGCRVKRFHPKSRNKRQVLMLLGTYRPSCHAGIARYGGEAGWTLDTWGGRLPVWWHGDGIIALVATERDCASLRLLPEVPLVDMAKGWLSQDIPPRMRREVQGRPRVLYDNIAIARLAAEHFLQRGFRHIALFNFGNWWFETERIPTFRHAVEAAGAQYHEIPYYRHFSLTSSVKEEIAAFRWLTTTLRKLPKPLGIFAGADDLALVALRACAAAGLLVPEEVAVLGCDNEPLVCNFAPVPLSSVDSALEQQGYAAAQLLDRLMDGCPPPREPIIIPPKGVVTRQSTNILAVPHLPLAKALRFIQEHHHQPIQARDIAVAAGMSIRGLALSFQKHLQRSIVDELTRYRIEQAKQLLLTTNLKAYEVAAQTGFSGLMYFSRAFKKTVGHPPGQFRRQHKLDP